MLTKLELAKILTKIMTMGTGTSLPVKMSQHELAKIIGIIYKDNGLEYLLVQRDYALWQQIKPIDDYYYNIPLNWFDTALTLSPGLHISLIEYGISDIPDFLTYLKCLCEIHKRRKKYAKILLSQPIPEMIQISPRALIEYGYNDPHALASWLTWRKFFFDLDNRAAQETGYLFEPILASALGGIQVSAKQKIVTRENDESKGRQIDCWKVVSDDENNDVSLAYEFKLRVTIAASGQGRFGEEIQFAVDARLSGAVPILLVLDPTMNHRLDELKRAYISNGGHAFIGQEAWDHLEEEAGEVMSNFIERYVRDPIEHISSYELDNNGFIDAKHENLLDLHASHNNGILTIGLGEHIRKICRYEDESMRDESDLSPDE